MPYKVYVRVYGVIHSFGPFSSLKKAKLEARYIDHIPKSKTPYIKKIK